jgi:hypothetical protein
MGVVLAQILKQLVGVKFKQEQSVSRFNSDVGLPIKEVYCILLIVASTFVEDVVSSNGT